MANRIHCIYSGCNLGCRTKFHHRAKYAMIAKRRPKQIKVLVVKKKKKKRSTKINWSVLEQSDILK